MIFVIIIAHAAQKSQHNFRFFRPAAADERLPFQGSWRAAPERLSPIFATLLAAQLFGVPEYYIEKSDIGTGNVEIHPYQLPDLDLAEED